MTADTITILATGPLTSAPHSPPNSSASPAPTTSPSTTPSLPSSTPRTIDMDKVYFAARWDKGTADYINCPFTKEEYDRFIEALTSAEAVPAKEWEQIPVSPTSVSS